jgi:hypothetical protein
MLDICGKNNTIAAANATLYDLETSVSDLRGTLVAAIDLTGCSSISPIFRRVLFGETCSKSMNGLAWLYSGTSLVLVLGLVILSHRAALYNPVIRGRRRKRREKEFADYKEYMAQFYDTKHWSLDFIPAISIENDAASGNPVAEGCDSDDTNSTSSSSPPISDEIEGAKLTDIPLSPQMAPVTVLSNEGEIFVNLSAPDTPAVAFQATTSFDTADEEDDVNSDDSYDSTYSSDGEDETSRLSSFSMINQLFKKSSSNASAHFQESSEEIASTNSNSSFFNRFVAVPGKSLREQILHLHGSRHKNQPNRADLYGPRDDSDDESERDGDDDTDSTGGVMFTTPPPSSRYPLSFASPSNYDSSRRNLYEEKPLTPSPPPAENPATKAPAKKLKALSRSSIY